MVAYLVVDVELTDAEKYEEYKQKAKPLVEKYGGVYLARGGQISIKERDLWEPKRIVLLQFPSSLHTEAFYKSNEYQSVLMISKISAKRTVFSLEGV